MAMNVNPIPLIAGIAGVPVLAGLIARPLITLGQPAAVPDNMAILRNAAILNAVLTGGLGFAATRSRNADVRSAALGGAIGTGLVAALLAAALLSARSAPANGGTTTGQLSAGVRHYVPGFVSHIAGLPRGA